MAMDFSTSLTRYVGHRVQVRLGSYTTIFGTLVQANTEFLRLADSRTVSEYDESDWFSKISESDPEMTAARSDGETVVRMNYVASVTCISDEPVDMQSKEHAHKNRSDDLFGEDWGTTENEGDENEGEEADSDDANLEPSDGSGASNASVRSQSSKRAAHGSASGNATGSTNHVLTPLSVEAQWEKNGVGAVTEICVELGTGLIKLADPARGGTMLNRVLKLRYAFDQEVGFPLPKIRFRDVLAMPVNEYRIVFGGTEYGRFTLHPDQQLLVLNKEYENTGTIREPSFGIPSRWTTETDIECAKYGTCVSSESVLATHLSELFKAHASELISFDCVSTMVDRLRADYPILVDELVPEFVSIRLLYQILVRMLREGISIRNLRRILEAIGEVAAKRMCDDDVYRFTRRILGRIVCAPYIQDNASMDAVVLEPQFEREVTESIRKQSDGSQLAMVYSRIWEASVGNLEQPIPLVITGGDIRDSVWSLLNSSYNKIPVLAYSEIPKGIRVNKKHIISPESNTECDGNDGSIVTSATIDSAAPIAAESPNITGAVDHSM